MSSSGWGKKKSCLEIDRISNLPDYVLCHILSFLETKLSISTCVLSKRWKSLWIDVPCLHFHGLPTPNPSVDLHFLRSTEKLEAAFEKLVTVSLLMNICQSLDKFRLMCLHDVNRLNVLPVWLNTVIIRNVRLLELNFMSSKTNSGLLTLPSNIFNAKSLEILRLEGDLLVQTLSSVSLPRLEYLSLKRVKYGCDESVRKLIRGCSVLKSLYIERNRYDNIGVFNITSKSLTRLEIKAKDFEFEEGDVYLRHILEIDASNLKYLRICDCLSRDFSIQNLPVLSELHILDDDDDYGHNMRTIYKSKMLVCTVVEALGEELEILTIGGKGCILHFFLLDLTKSFSSLTKLIVTSTRPKYRWAHFRYLLLLTVNLEVLELKSFCHVLDEDEQYEISKCLSSSLKRITISFEVELRYEDEVVRMMKYFLKHGNVLRRIEITGYNYGSSFLGKLLALNRSSSACIIQVLY